MHAGPTVMGKVSGIEDFFLKRAFAGVGGDRLFHVARTPLIQQPPAHSCQNQPTRKLNHRERYPKEPQYGCADEFKHD